MYETSKVLRLVNRIHFLFFNREKIKFIPTTLYYTHGDTIPNDARAIDEKSIKVQQ